MTSEMIERAADAILAKVPLGYGMTRPEALEYARAAIEAMRNPTDEIFNGKFGRHPRQMFTEMIDAALNPPSTRRL